MPTASSKCSAQNGSLLRASRCRVLEQDIDWIFGRDAQFSFQKIASFGSEDFRLEGKEGLGGIGVLGDGDGDGTLVTFFFSSFVTSLVSSLVTLVVTSLVTLVVKAFSLASVAAFV